MTITRRGITLSILAALAYVVSFVGLITQTPIKPEADVRFPPGSSMRRAPGGARLAMEYLQARGHRVARLTDSNVGSIVATAVVFVLRPALPSGTPEIRPLLTEAEERFLRNGGRIVLTLDGSLPSIVVSRAPASSTWRRTHPLLPDGALKRPLETHALSGPWMGEAHSLLASGDQVVAARREYGKGDMVVIGSPDVFTNERLAPDGETLPWLDALADGRDVYFDETVHGLFETQGVFDLLRAWGLMPGVLAIALCAAAWAFRASSSFGPPERRPRVNYADGIDLLEALGTLYGRSVTEEEALARYRPREKGSALAPRLRGDKAIPLVERLREINSSNRRSRVK